MREIELIFDRPLQTIYGTWHEYLFSYEGTEVIVMAYGKWRESAQPLVRINSSCHAAHYLASIECDCREQLFMAYERIAAAGAGLVVLLDQDGRGNGHYALMRAAVLSKERGCTQGEAYRFLGFPADARSYVGAMAALHLLGVAAVTLMTNNPAKIQAFADEGIDVVMMPVIADNTPQRSLDRYYELKYYEGHCTKR